MSNNVFSGHEYDDLGIAINGALVNLYDEGTTTPSRADTTTNSLGFWTISHATEGTFDVQVTNGTSIRRRKYLDEVQLKRIEVADFFIRNPGDTFKYNITPGAITAERILNLPLLTGTATLATIDEGIKGADISSVGAALTLVAGSDYADVTGTTTVTSISTRPAGSRFTFQFDGALILTHNATSLILQGATNLTTAAGDVLTFISEGSGNWREESRRLAASQTAHTQSHDHSASADGQTLQPLNLDLTAATELTIATGDITATQNFHSVDTESDAASDDLIGIIGGSAGRMLVLRPANDARTVVVKHNGSAAASDNILLADDTDFTMDRLEDTITLLYDATLDTNGAWVEISRSTGGSTAYTDAEAIAAVEGEATLDLTGRLSFDKGADLASGATVTPGTDGNYFDITGTTTITAIGSLRAGTLIFFHFDGVLTLTHNATSLILQGATNLTTAAGDVVAFISRDGTNWEEAWRRLAAAAGGGTAPVFARVVRTAGDINTTNTALVDLTGATVTFTTGAFPVAYSGTITRKLNAVDEMFFNVDVDGGLQLGTAGLRITQQTVSDPYAAPLSGLTAALTAASHTLKVQWKVVSGTGTVLGNSAESYLWEAHEIR